MLVDGFYKKKSEIGRPNHFHRAEMTFKLLLQATQFQTNQASAEYVMFPVLFRDKFPEQRKKT